MHSRKLGGLYLLLFMLSGIVIGGFIGKYLGEFPYLGFLNYGKTFGLSAPMVLDLSVIKITLGILLEINIAGVIGILIGIFAYKKLF